MKFQHVKEATQGGKASVSVEDEREEKQVEEASQESKAGEESQAMKLKQVNEGCKDAGR